MTLNVRFWHIEMLQNGFYGQTRAKLLYYTYLRKKDMKICCIMPKMPYLCNFKYAFRV